MTAGTRYRFGVRSLVVFVLCGGLWIGMAGCGRKGPPVAPRMVPSPAVADLEATVANGHVTLDWRIPSGVDAALPDGFRIYRAELGSGDCGDCPMLFAKIGELQLDSQQRPAPDKPWRLSWRDTPAPGLRYVYKVSAYGRGRETVDSNLVGVRP